MEFIIEIILWIVSFVIVFKAYSKAKSQVLSLTVDYSSEDVDRFAKYKRIFISFFVIAMLIYSCALSFRSIFLIALGWLVYIALIVYLVKNYNRLVDLFNYHLAKKNADQKSSIQKDIDDKNNDNI